MGQIFWGGVAAVALMYAAFLVVGWLAARKVKEGTPADPPRPLGTTNAT